jgi:hypothetical protein
MSQAGRFGSGGIPVGVVETLTGDTGGPVSPDGLNNIDVLGGGTYINITTVGNTVPNQLLINLNDDVTLAGFLTALGDISTGSNFSMPETSADGLHGIFYVNGNPFIRTANNANSFIGFDAGNNLIGAGIVGNIGIGDEALQSLISGQYNTVMGYTAGQLLTTGDLNVFIGNNSGQSNASGDQNTGVGDGSLANLTSGNKNIALGQSSGINYASSESSNIVIGNNGTVAEDNTIRIGTQGSGSGEQDRTFIAGIHSVTPSGGSILPVVIDSNGQLGTGSASTVYAYTNVNSSPYVVLSTDEFLGVDVSAIPITIQLPNTPTTGQSFTIKDRTGNSSLNNITVTTVGGVVLIDGAVSYTMNTDYASINVLFDGVRYQIF